MQKNTVIVNFNNEFVDLIKVRISLSNGDFCLQVDDLITNDRKTGNVTADFITFSKLTENF